MYILLETLAPNKEAARNPTPVPRYVRPAIPVLKWYTFEKRSEQKLSMTIPVGRYDLTGESRKHQVVDT